MATVSVPKRKIFKKWSKHYLFSIQIVEAIWITWINRSYIELSENLREAKFEKNKVLKFGPFNLFIDTLDIYENLC